MFTNDCRAQDLGEDPYRCQGRPVHTHGQRRPFAWRYILLTSPVFAPADKGGQCALVVSRGLSRHALQPA